MPEVTKDKSADLYQYKVSFDIFKHEHGKQYTLEEEAFRFVIFKKNIDKINKHNADSTQTYEMGITQFADMTTE